MRCKLTVCTEFVIPPLQQLINHVFDCTITVNLSCLCTYVINSEIGAIGIAIKARRSFLIIAEYFMHGLNSEAVWRTDADTYTLGRSDAWNPAEFPYDF